MYYNVLSAGKGTKRRAVRTRTRGLGFGIGFGLGKIALPFAAQINARARASTPQSAAVRQTRNTRHPVDFAGTGPLLATSIGNAR